MNIDIINQLNVIFLVLMRLTGMVFLNPIFSRNNIPFIFRIGLTLGLSYIAIQMIPMEGVVFHNNIEFAVIVLKEFIIGFFIGYLVYGVIAIFMISGEIIDMQLGISMAKMYDPQSNISMPVIGSVFNLMFMIIFFLTNAHLTIIAIMIQSFHWVLPGEIVINEELFVVAIQFMGLVFTLALKLALPIIVVQLIAEIAVGIIMKAIPQINVFVLNIQIKLLVGFIVVFTMVASFAEFIEQTLEILLANIENAVRMLFI